MVKIYSDQEIWHLKTQFMIAIKTDNRSLDLKLKSCGISKGTYSVLINDWKSEHNSYHPSRKIMESMRAFLEKRSPKFHKIKTRERYCTRCEEILSVSRMKSRWECKECHIELNSITTSEKIMLLARRRGIQSIISA